MRAPSNAATYRSAEADFTSTIGSTDTPTIGSTDAPAPPLDASTASHADESPDAHDDEAFVQFTKVAAYGLPDADPEAGLGSTDPYIVFIVRCEGRAYKGRTTTIENPPHKAVSWTERP